MRDESSAPRSGYIYVLIHPSDPELFKVGVTVRSPRERLAQHNAKRDRVAGRVVTETGQPWELKEFHPVPDPYFAESVFWNNTTAGYIPFRGGVEVERMPWAEVERALEAAKSAGVRPPRRELPTHVYAYTAQIKRRLSGRGINLHGHVNSIISGRNDFSCINGHRWRTTPRVVGEGGGCPECGVGERSPEEIVRLIGAGLVCLLTHPEQSEIVNVRAATGTLDELTRDWPWGDWELHRYRRVDNVDMAERIAWALLGHPLPHDRQPIELPRETAEDVFRRLIYAVAEEFANEERRNERLGNRPEP
jgi:hypothetical protein